MSEEYDTYGEAIRELRKRRRMSGRDLCVALNHGAGGEWIDPQRLSKIEHGRLPPPSHDERYAIAHELLAYWNSDEGDRMYMALERLAAHPYVPRPDIESEGATMIVCGRLSEEAYRAQWEAKLEDWNRLARGAGQP